MNGIVAALSEVATGMTSAKAIYDTADGIYRKRNTSKYVSLPLTVNIQESAKVDEPVKIYGTGSGIVQIYSSWKLERERLVDKTGYWATGLYFSVPGIYALEVTDMNQQKTVTIRITKL